MEIFDILFKVLVIVYLVSIVSVLHKIKDK